MVVIETLSEKGFILDLHCLWSVFFADATRHVFGSDYEVRLVLRKENMVAAWSDYRTHVDPEVSRALSCPNEHKRRVVEAYWRDPE